MTTAVGQYGELRAVRETRTEQNTHRQEATKLPALVTSPGATNTLCRETDGIGVSDTTTLIAKEGIAWTSLSEAKTQRTAFCAYYS